MTWGSSAALKLQEMFVLPNSSLVSVCQFSFQPALCLRIHISWWFHQKLHHVCITSQYLVSSAVFSKPSESAWKDLCPIQPGGVPDLIFEDLSKSSRKTHNFSRNAAQSKPNILLPPETFAAKPSHWKQFKLTLHSRTTSAINNNTNQCQYRSCVSRPTCSNKIRQTNENQKSNQPAGSLTVAAT